MLAQTILIASLPSTFCVGCAALSCLQGRQAVGLVRRPALNIGLWRLASH